MKNNPTGAMGLADYLGWSWKSKAGIPIVNIPGCPAQGDNITETLMYLVFALAGMAPLPELDDALRPKWLFERTAHESCNRAGFYEQGNFATEYGVGPPLPREARLQGAGGQVQRPAARVDQRDRRLPQRRRHLHGVHDAGLPRQVHAVHGPRSVGERGRELRRSSRTGPSSGYFRKRNLEKKFDKEPEWRHNRAELTTGYAKRW